ncbi:MAG: hypothetical protein ACFE0P_11525 [Oceanicaulis sp.]
MLELGHEPTVAVEAAHDVSLIRGATRLAAFDLRPGAAVPETDPRPALVIAETPVALRIAGAGLAEPVELAAGQSLYLPDGVAGIENVGPERARFVLIGLSAGANAPLDPPVFQPTVSHME